ncbi:conserved exported hypothetical protein [Syntrophobacter sp. SbD1]|nr:conserved exported hypothetical protein [Syntrophobacter sp. SbD1]
MRTGLLFLSPVIAVVFLISASQVIAADIGAQYVSAADRLSIEQFRYSGQWKGNDLSVEYSYSKDQGQMDLSGNVRFSNSLIMGYTELKDFRLGAIFLDQNGKVLEQIGLATNRDSFDPIPFNRRINIPSNAVFMAFSYQRKACDQGRGKTSFWFYPIH